MTSPGAPTSLSCIGRLALSAVTGRSISVLAMADAFAQARQERERFVLYWGIVPTPMKVIDQASYGQLLRTAKDDPHTSRIRVRFTNRGAVAFVIAANAPHCAQR